MSEESVSLGGRSVRRMGFGAMQLPGPGVFGPPRDRSVALSVVRRAVEAGVNHIDTAQFYGPDVANELLREALYPYPDDLVIVSKVGAARDDRGQWYGTQRPDQLRAGVEANLASLGLEQIPVVNLRRHPESDVLFTEQVEAMESLRQEGLIGAIGLSNVDLDQYRTAQTVSTSCPSRTPTTWRIPQGRASSPLAERTVLPLCRFFRWARPSTPRTQCSAQPPSGLRRIDSVQHRLKLRSPGCSARLRPYRLSLELRHPYIWKRILLQQIWSSTKRRVKHSHSGKGGRLMALNLLDHVGITVADLDLVTAFFVTLGLEVEGRAVVEGEFVDTVIGIPGSRSDIVMLRPPGGGTALELSSFVRPDHLPDRRPQWPMSWGCATSPSRWTTSRRKSIGSPRRVPPGWWRRPV